VNNCSFELPALDHTYDLISIHGIMNKANDVPTKNVVHSLISVKGNKSQHFTAHGF
jgi:hypothetical protein